MLCKGGVRGQNSCAVRPLGSALAHRPACALSGPPGHPPSQDPHLQSGGTRAGLESRFSKASRPEAVSVPAQLHPGARVLGAWKAGLLSPRHTRTALSGPPSLRSSPTPSTLPPLCLSGPFTYLILLG